MRSAAAAAAAALLRREASRHSRCLSSVCSLPSARKPGPILLRALGPAAATQSASPTIGRRAASSSSSSSSFASSSSSSDPEPIQDAYDAIVVGGGHNGLVAALLLAREGGENFKVALFDADEAGCLGGAARTERPFSPDSAARDLRHSTGAYLLGPFPPELLEFCGLGDLPVVRRSPHYFLPASPNGDSTSERQKSLLSGNGKSGGKGNGGVFFYAGDEAATRESFLSTFSEKDWLAMKAMDRELARIREAFAPAMLCPSPATAEDVADAFLQSSGPSSSSSSSSSSPSSSSHTSSAAVSDAFVSLVRGSVADYLDRFDFESETLKAMFCATDGLSGATASPYDRGTGYNFLLHNMVRLKGTDGAWALVRGGMGTVTQRLAENARRAGASLVRARVAALETRSSGGSGGGGDGLVAEGVVLSCGKKVRARVGVVVACDPWALCGLSEAVAASPADSFWPRSQSSASAAAASEPSSSASSKSTSPSPSPSTSFRERLDALYVPATTFKLNLALSALPAFSCLLGREEGESERGGARAGPEHRTTSHLLSSSPPPSSSSSSSPSSSPSPVDLLHDACVAALEGDLSYVDVRSGRHPPIEFYFHSAADPSVMGGGGGGGGGGEEEGYGKRSECHSAALFVQLSPHAPGVSFLKKGEQKQQQQQKQQSRRDSCLERPLYEATGAARAAGPASFEASKRAWTPEATDAYARSLLAAAEEGWCPGLSQLVVDAVPYPPPAIESKFGISGGHIHHVQNTAALGQRVPLRLAPNLFFASAGAHPGGSVTGAPGHNAAAALLALCSSPMSGKREEVLSWPTIKGASSGGRRKGASASQWKEFLARNGGGM